MEATFWDRAAAWGYDCLGFQILYFAVSKAMPDSFLVSFFLFIFFFASYIFYNVFFESRFGATLGKFAVGIGVEDLFGQDLSMLKSTERQLTAGLSWVTLNVGHVIALHRKDKKMLHDLVSGTKVVKKEIDIPHLPYLSPSDNQKLKFASFALQGLLFLITLYVIVIKVQAALDVVYQNASGV